MPLENEHISNSKIQTASAFEKNEEQAILYETRSEEVQEIMGRMPTWIIRWGITVIGFVVIGLFIGSNYIKYPDRVNASVSISSDNPPVKIVSPNTGRIKQLYVKQNDSIGQNDILLIIENQANYNDVITLKEELLHKLLTTHASSIIEKNYQLGELQQAYSELITASETKSYYEKSDNSNLSIAQIQKQIVQNQQLITQMQKNESKLIQNYQIDKKIHDIDYKLYKQKMLTENEYLQSKKQWLEKQTSINENKNNIASNYIRQSELNKDIIDIEVEKKKKQFEGTTKIEQAIKNLLSLIEQWELKYIIKSPIAGCVNLYSIWKENQYIYTGENIMLIVPPVQNMIAKGIVPIQNSGKIAVGQQIMIGLASHPQNEFGYLKGTISYIATAPMDSVYAFDITLQNRLTTTNKKVIPTQPQMYGIGEIFTDDKTLIKRLFEKF
ncbi:MAG: HlyD family efflux transporter periplasmic adaptor subunit [Chitinophagaceae bacterium]